MPRQRQGAWPKRERKKGGFLEYGRGGEVALHRLALSFREQNHAVDQGRERTLRETPHSLDLNSREFDWGSHRARNRQLQCHGGCRCGRLREPRRSKKRDGQLGGQV